MFTSVLGTWAGTKGKWQDVPTQDLISAIINSLAQGQYIVTQKIAL
ncbi:MAG: hypothetical protein RMZ69_15050 [Nostoc sp. ChiQUE01a]|nr:hypothetical protein [Nostoc sp. ChiQUE01a]